MSAVYLTDEPQTLTAARRQSGVDPQKLRSRREIGIPMALWELCGKRLCLGFVVELLNCGTLCTEVDEEFRESFGGEPLQ